MISSCDSNRYFEENKPVENGKWSSSDKLRYEVPVSDTVSQYDFYLNIRNSTGYSFSNLWLFIHTTNPEGKMARDTMECLLADHTGKWFGSGSGSIKFNRFLVQKGVQFPRKGKYIFEIEQAMRVKDLKGIMDVGIRMEKSEKND